MSTINKDLGAVSAYGFAKDSGYTGTVTQFETGLAAAANLGSTITTALNSKADLVSGTVPSSQLPSYVDDVIDGYYYNENFYSDSSHLEQITPETGKIYIDVITNGSYRWSGSTFIEIASNSISYDNGVIFSKIDGSVTLSNDTVTLDDDHTTATVTVSNATGAVSVSSSNTSIATASISGNTITISSVNSAIGTATIVVSVASGATFNAVTKDIAVTTSFRAAGVVTLSTNSVTLDADHLTGTVTVSNATGTVSVSSSDTSVATASISNDTITISSVNSTTGTAIITVSVAQTSTHNATTATISVNAAFINVPNASDPYVQVSNIESFIDNYSVGQICFQGDGNGKFYVKAGSYTDGSNPNIASTGTLIYDGQSDMGETINNYVAAAHLGNIMNYILYNTKGSSYGSNTALFTDTPTTPPNYSQVSITKGFSVAYGYGSSFICYARDCAGYYDGDYVYSNYDCAVWW